MTLPALIPLAGDWNAYLDSIYERYVHDIIQSSKTFRGKPVRARFNPATQNKGFSFWHVISEGQSESERLPDLRRCERIGWIAWVLEGADAGDLRIKTLESERTLSRGSVDRLLLWLEEADYVVVLEERASYFLLVTAYQVYGHRAKKLKERWARSQK